MRINKVLFLCLVTLILAVAFLPFLYPFVRYMIGFVCLWIVVDFFRVIT